MKDFLDIAFTIAAGVACLCVVFMLLLAVINGLEKRP